ncbi:SDR family NAD(P)-dependent oxidoreductase [Pseudonocardia sp. H11422]|uniref:SDR family NAD(P)-dependent oxidoreductase n=1 Tax=Pseudonocardia sp. H11422 TaxID=2835866 RepID=UPI001BDC38CD|nr:SDR family NAD(P)-dependent oxidoreductase [Pseudonocardia sp. H11422]
MADRLAVVSGGTYGVGRAVVFGLLEDGFRVATFSNDGGQVKDLQAEFGDREDVLVEEADVRDLTQLENFVERATGRFGPVRALVNNAAVRPTGSVLDTSEETWDVTVDVNLKGQFLLCKAAVPSMIEAGGGSVVNFSSVSAYGGGAHVAYVASKAGVLGLTKALAYDLAKHRIRVNAIVPGFILSGMSEPMVAHRPEILEVVKGMNAQGRVGMPEDYARTVRFLLSDAADIMSGAVLDVGLVPGVFPDDAALF